MEKLFTKFDNNLDRLDKWFTKHSVKMVGVVVVFIVWNVYRAIKG